MLNETLSLPPTHLLTLKHNEHISCQIILNDLFENPKSKYFFLHRFPCLAWWLLPAVSLLIPKTPKSWRSRDSTPETAGSAPPSPRRTGLCTGRRPRLTGREWASTATSTRTDRPSPWGTLPARTASGSWRVCLNSIEAPCLCRHYPNLGAQVPVGANSQTSPAHDPHYESQLQLGQHNRPIAVSNMFSQQGRPMWTPSSTLTTPHPQTWLTTPTLPPTSSMATS